MAASRANFTGDGITGHAMMFRLLIAAAVWLSVFCQQAGAHAGDALIPVQLAVAEWATAHQSRDIEALSSLLTDDFNGSAAARDAYFAALSLRPVKQVILRHASYQIERDTARVSSVVHVPYRELLIPFALTLTLEHGSEGWRITSITESDQLPEEYPILKHEHLYVTHPVEFSLSDKATGRPVHARVHIRDAQGEYWPPRGFRKVIAEGWREDIGGEVIVEGKNWAYVDPHFEAALPEGTYTMEITRGPEYIAQQHQFTVAAGQVPRLQIQLERWINMADQGWYSGDTHTHFLEPYVALQEAKGEDLRVINVLSSSGGNLVTQVHQFTGAPSVVSDAENIVYISEETRHDYLGHTVLLNLKEHVWPFGWGGPITGVHNGFDYPTMAQQADKVHNQEGALVAWSHLPHPHGELPIDIALGKIDAVETMVFGDPAVPHPARVGMGEFTPDDLIPLELWYHILNTGHDMPGLGSTDKMWNTQVVGAVRTYVQLEAPLTYDRWVEGIRNGRTQFSTGPALTFSLAGRAIGDTLEVEEPTSLNFETQVSSHFPVDRIEIIQNGEVVAALENSEGLQNLSFHGLLDIQKSSWVAARAYSSHTLPTQAQLTGGGSPVFAHTSPIYLQVDQHSRVSPESARYLLKIVDKTIAWAKTMARYHSEAQRKEVVELYQTARDRLATQLEID